MASASRALSSTTSTAAATCRPGYFVAGPAVAADALLSQVPQSAREPREYLAAIGLAVLERDAEHVEGLVVDLDAVVVRRHDLAGRVDRLDVHRVPSSVVHR